MSREMISPKNLLSDALLKAVEENPQIVLLSADSGPNSGFSPFIEKYPDKYFEFGIMEQGVMGIASGFATTGLMPVFCAPSPFVTGRPYEMLRIDVGYMQQNVKLIGRNAGFSYSDLGPTHYGLDDFTLVRAIPDIVIIAPQDADEVTSAFEAMINYEGPVYMRVGSGSFPKLFDSTPFEIGKGRVIQDGSDVAIISTGNMTERVIDALDILDAEGISPMVIGMPTLNPIDVDLVKKAAKLGKIVTVEEHFTKGGLGTIVSEVCSEYCPAIVKPIGIENHYATSGDYDVMTEFYGLDPKGIAKKIIDFTK
ncbi:MAG: transketolase family protein [Suipraeoptans sp.]